MTTFLAYTSPAAGHAFPLVPGLLELQDRVHEIHMRTDPSLVAGLRRAGVRAAGVDPRIKEIRPGAHRPGPDGLRSAYRALLARAPFERPDLEAAVAETGADVLLTDVLAYGAGLAAEATGLPWALTVPSLLPLPGKGIPPYGLGLPPARGPIGAVRDRLGWRLVERAYSKALLPGLNDLRRQAGLPELASPLDQFGLPSLVLGLSGPPLEYPRTDLPPNVSVVGACPWHPPPSSLERPPCLDEEGDPWVLVTCSTDYQGESDSRPRRWRPFVTNPFE